MATGVLSAPPSDDQDSPAWRLERALDSLDDDAWWRSAQGRETLAALGMHSPVDSPVAGGPPAAAAEYPPSLEEDQLAFMNTPAVRDGAFGVWHAPAHDLDSFNFLLHDAVVAHDAGAHGDGGYETSHDEDGFGWHVLRGAAAVTPAFDDDAADTQAAKKDGAVLDSAALLALLLEQADEAAPAAAVAAAAAPQEATLRRSMRQLPAAAAPPVAEAAAEAAAAAPAPARRRAATDSRARASKKRSRRVAGTDAPYGGKYRFTPEKKAALERAVADHPHAWSPVKYRHRVAWADMNRRVLRGEYALLRDNVAGVDCKALRRKFLELHPELNINPERDVRGNRKRKADAAAARAARER